MSEFKSFRCETAFKHQLWVNTIPTLDAADALAVDVTKAIEDKMAAKVSDVDVIVTAVMYDDQVDGIVEYKVNCSFTLQPPYIDIDKESTKNLAFYVGVDVADSFEQLGHYVDNFKITQSNVEPIKGVKHQNCYAMSRD